MDYNYEYEYEYDPNISTISAEELAVPLFVYSLTFVLGVVGNILILVAVSAQKQVFIVTQSFTLNNQSFIDTGVSQNIIKSLSHRTVL